jgi:hypothetical protein
MNVINHNLETSLLYINTSNAKISNKNVKNAKNLFLDNNIMIT